MCRRTRVSVAERVFGEKEWTGVAPSGVLKVIKILSDLVHDGDFIR
jgi:hypothetical protein